MEPNPNLFRRAGNGDPPSATLAGTVQLKPSKFHLKPSLSDGDISRGRTGLGFLVGRLPSSLCWREFQILCPPATAGRPATPPSDPLHSETFTIHGLWPNYNNGSYPQFCDCADPFSLPMLEKNLTKAMDCNWPSYAGALDARTTASVEQRPCCWTEAVLF